MLPLLIFSVLPLLHLTLCNPIQKLDIPNDWILDITPNSTFPASSRLQVDFHYIDSPSPWAAELQKIGAQVTIIHTVIKAFGFGLENLVPPSGIWDVDDKVRLNAYPLDGTLTWKMMAFMLVQVREELRAKGYFACSWRLIGLKDDGGFEKFLAGGEMLPTEGGVESS